MATRDVQNSEANSSGKLAQSRGLGWFAGFVRELNKLSLTLNRTFIVIGALVLGAAAVSYWGVDTGRQYVATGAAVVWAMAMLAWVAVSGYMLWTVAVGLVKWRNRRRAVEADQLTSSGSG